MHLYLKTEFQPAFRSEQIFKWTASSQHYFSMAVNINTRAKALGKNYTLHFFIHKCEWYHSFVMRLKRVLKDSMDQTEGSSAKELGGNLTDLKCSVLLVSGTLSRKITDSCLATKAVFQHQGKNSLSFGSHNNAAFLQKIIHIPLYSINLLSCLLNKPSAILFCLQNTLVSSNIKDFCFFLSIKVPGFN